MTYKPESGISVLLAAFNAERFVREALESVLADLPAEGEVVVVDDGSRDGTRRIIESMASADGRIVPVLNERNLGLVASLNRGLERCRGEYVVRMDADDVSLPGRIARQVAFLEAHPEVAVVGGCIVLIDEAGRRIGEFVPPLRPRDVRCYAAVGSPFCHPAVTFRKSAVLAAGGYREDECHAEDYGLWVRLLEAGYEGANLPEVVLRWRRYGTNVSQRHRAEQTATARRTRQWYVERAGLDGQCLRQAALAYPGGAAWDWDALARGRTDGLDPVGRALGGSSVEARARKALAPGAPAGLMRTLAADDALPGWLRRVAALRELRDVEALPPLWTGSGGTVRPLPVVAVLPVTAGDAPGDLEGRLRSLAGCARRPDRVLVVGVGAGEAAVEVAVAAARREGLDAGAAGDWPALGSALEAAQAAARGALLAYLLPGYRFAPEFLAEAERRIAGGEGPMVCAPVAELYADCRLDGEPLVEVFPRTPRAAREMVFLERGYRGPEKGRGMIHLSGIAHRNDGAPEIWRLSLGIGADAPAYDWLLAADLLHRVPCEVVGCTNRVTRPDGFQLESRLWPELYRETVLWYLERGYGAIPWEAVAGGAGTRAEGERERVDAVARKLEVLLRSGFPVTDRNRRWILAYFLRHSRFPVRHALFRSLCRFGVRRRLAWARETGGLGAMAKVAAGWAVARFGGALS